MAPIATARPTLWGLPRRGRATAATTPRRARCRTSRPTLPGSGEADPARRPLGEFAVRLSAPARAALPLPSPPVAACPNRDRRGATPCGPPVAYPTKLHILREDVGELTARSET